MKLLFRCIALASVFTGSILLFRSSTKLPLARESPRSPSLDAPLVIAVCSAPLNTSNDSIIPTDDDTDESYSRKLLHSWLRQEKQITTMLNSLLFFSRSPTWRIAVLTDSIDTFNKVLHLTEVFPPSQRQRLRLEHHSQWYPDGYTGITTNWRPCAWAKQFMTQALPQESAAVYVDTDIVFLGPAEELWENFELMKAPQLVALAPEPMYLEENKHRDYAGRVGLNTGVMVANLTRMRQLPGGGLGSAALSEGILNPRPRHDQDAINHFLKPKPHLFRELTARWNFIPSSCSPSAPPCPDCESRGILILHGADMSFLRFVDAKFKMIFAALARMRLDEEPNSLLNKIGAQLAVIDSHKPIFPCSNYSDFNKGLTYGFTHF